ncbi:penicillin acylase family protein [Sphingopyxis sp.]|uniref:penicillin acylase family protein n=1 Tax=Sphingopyxis sp. TaxID=1908224 RepID=UPI0025E7AE04|nr:penicillin acylase family protein [Sphingopyxis sp.]
MAAGSQFYLTTATALLAIAGFPLTSTAAPAPITEVQTPREPGPLMAPGKSNIFRDEWGMAHIYAAREEDGFFALGFATAEDRIDQLLLIYLATKGELAANFGPGPIGADKVTPHLANAIKDSVASDVAVRRFRILESARENLAQLPEQYRRNLDAYIAGINRYLADNPAKRPAWAPVLEPAMPLAAFSQLVAEAAQICPSRIAALESKAPAPAEPALKGSNAWVAGPSRVANGGVLFSSDSHGPWSAIGTLFYAWRMKAGDFDFQAFEPTGTAMPFFGHSRDFAWGWTEGPRFAGDCYRVETLADDSSRYRFDQETRRFETIPYRVEVKGAAPVTGQFEYTRHNGLLSPVVERRGRNAFVASYASIDRVGLGHGRMYNMAKAQNLAELRAELAAMDIYPANLLIGGADGSIFYVRPGRIPIRKPGIDPSGVVDGNSARTAWQGFVTLDQTIKVENPAQGYVVNDNVSPDMMYPERVIIPDEHPPHLALEPGQTTLRQLRHMELLERAEKLTDQDAIRLTMDEKIYAFDRWATRLKSIDDAQFGSGNGIAEFLAQLRAFDGRLVEDSGPALAFSLFIDALNRIDGNAAYQMALEIVDGKPIALERDGLFVAAVRAAQADYAEFYGSLRHPVYGDRHKLSRGGKRWPGAGGSFVFTGMERHLDLQGGWNSRPFIAAPPRTMRYRAATDRASELTAFCCQRVPFVVAFHPGGRLNSYSQFLPGLSDDPASPHFDDQLALASSGTLRSNHFELRELLPAAQSMKILSVTQ